MQPDFEREEIEHEGPSVSQRAANVMDNSMRLDQSVQSIGGNRLRTSQEDTEYTQFKIEQRKLLEEKIQAQKRIESLKREYDFIFKLKPNEVNDLLTRKAEYAAIRIQRNFRERRQRRMLIE